MHKECLGCSEIKHLDDFNLHKGGKMGRRSKCKKCLADERLKYKDSKREWSYLKKYGITIKDYDNMLNNQNGCCKICGTTDPSPKKLDNHFFVDHCHQTGKVRGLLCNWCNRGLGYFKDNQEILLKAKDYLDEC